MYGIETQKNENWEKAIEKIMKVYSSSRTEAEVLLFEMLKEETY